MTQLTRRMFCAGSLAALARSQARYAVERNVAEWSFTSGKPYADPFNEVALDLVVTTPSGAEQRVPAFWAGEQTWRVRYAPPAPGRYTYRTVCNDTSNADLHGRSGPLTVEPYAGENPLYRHGGIRVAADRRHFEHSDGTPFFWLGDTWWMGLCKRLRWPEDFQALGADRAAKGFSVVQIVAGLYPDMPPFDPRGANEAGYPWEKDYTRINPAYFDMADLRIQHLVSRGLVPCIVGCWGYFLPMMGVARMKQHWRNLVARWGAYPVVWCLAGEGTMPYYLTDASRRTEQSAMQKRGWTEVGRYVREIDPFHRLVTIHPSRSARESVEDESVLDFDMLQTGHSDRASIPNTVNSVVASQERQPKMPVLVGEVCYEGIMEASRQEVQRFMFWSSILNGAAGHTYGANGIWQVNAPDKPFGPSPHGRTWGNVPWDVAAQLPGSRMLGLGKGLLARHQWWRFEPHPEWVEPHWSKDNYMQPYAAGIPRQVRIIFTLPGFSTLKIKGLETGTQYTAAFFDPASGLEKPLGQITPSADGEWEVPVSPTIADWVVVLVANA